MAKTAQNPDTLQIRTQEAAQVRAALSRYRKVHHVKLTQAELAGEFDVGQALVQQWLSGATRIPDLTLLRLGKRLDFDAFSVRPSLNEYREFFQEDTLLEGLSPEQRAAIKTLVHDIKKPKAANED